MAEADSGRSADDTQPVERSGFSKWRPAIAGLIVLIFTVWVVWYVRHSWSAFAALGELEWPMLAGLLALFAAVITCNGFYVKIMLLVFDVRLPLREWLCLSIATSLLNYVTPFRGGAGMRAVYLKLKYGLSLIDFVSTLSAMYLMFTAVHGALGLVAAALLWSSSIVLPLPIVVFFACMTVIPVLLMVIPIRVPWSDRIGFRQLAKIMHGWAKIRTNPRILAGLLLLTVVYAVLSILQYKLAFTAVQAPVGWGQAMFYTAGQGLAMLITLTPGALGIAEWSALYLGLVLSCTPAQVLMVQLLMRASLLCVLLLAAPFATRFLVWQRTLARTPSASDASLPQ